MARRFLNVLLICCVVLCDEVPLFARLITPHILLETTADEADNDEAYFDPGDHDPVSGDDGSNDPASPDDTHLPIATNPEQDGDAEEASHSTEISSEARVSTHQSGQVLFVGINFPGPSCTFTHLRF